MGIKILILLACLLGSLRTKADVDIVQFRFGSDGTLTDISTSLTSDSMALTAPIIEPDGSSTDPEEVDAISDESFVEVASADNPTDDSNNDDSGDDEDPSDSTNPSLLRSPAVLKMATVSSEPSTPVRLLSASDTSDSGSNECPEGEQPAGEGCIECPNDGFVARGDDEYICCQDGHMYAGPEGGDRWNPDINMACVTCDIAGKCKCPLSGELTNGVCCFEGHPWDDENGYHGYNDEKVSPACGCPDGGTADASGEVCCKDGYMWDDEDQDYDIYTPSICGCPAGYEFVEEEEVCCDKANGTYIGMDDESDEDKSNAIRWCGCGTEYGTRIDLGSDKYVCCNGSSHEITKYTSDVMGEPSESDNAKYCGCEEGVFDSLSGQCVSCLSDEHCGGTKPYCVGHECVVCSETICGNQEKLCTANGCKSCSEINSGKPYYKDGQCYACLEDSHCSGGKVCNPNTQTCETCVLYTEVEGKNHGCESVTKVINQGLPTQMTISQPYCVQKTSSERGCSMCRYDADCAEISDEKTNCLREEGICTESCGSIGINPATGRCNCSGSTPVFNIVTQECVTCYDSISGAWTDLGCNEEPTNKTEPTGSPWNYSPWQDPSKKGKPVCWEGGNGGKGLCVRCTVDGHCDENQVCKSNMECGCPAGKPYLDGDICYECNANYKAETGAYKCAETKPLCKSGTCTCKDNYDTSQKNGDGKCTKNKPVCTNGACTVCSSQQIYDATEKKCRGCSGTGFTVIDGACKCAKGKWKKSDTECLDCPKDGKCTEVNDTSPCESPNKAVIEVPESGKKINKCVPCSKDSHCGSGKYCKDNKCVACTQDSHCANGKYCKNNACTKCAAGYACGCEYCANGSGGCYSAEELCQRVDRDMEGIENGMCFADTCGRLHGWDSCPSGWNHPDDCHIGGPHCRKEASIPTCTTCTSGQACRM